MSPSWFISTVLLSALGFYMWPQYFASVYTAKSEDVFRKNAVMLPLYQLVILFVFFAGFAAMLVVPGLTGADADLSLLRISRAHVRRADARAHRRGGPAHGAGAGLDDSHHGGDDPRAERLSSARRRTERSQRVACSRGGSCR